MNVPSKQNNFYIDYAISSLSCLSSCIVRFSMGTFLANFVLVFNAYFYTSLNFSLKTNMASFYLFFSIHRVSFALRVKDLAVHYVF